MECDPLTRKNSQQIINKLLRSFFGPPGTASDFTDSIDIPNNRIQLSRLMELFQTWQSYIIYDII